jgi:hypothetical protein
MSIATFSLLAFVLALAIGCAVYNRLYPGPSDRGGFR